MFMSGKKAFKNVGHLPNIDVLVTEAAAKAAVLFPGT